MEESMDFLPCHGAQILYLSPHTFTMAQRELTVFFQLPLLLQSRDVILLPILFP